MPLRHHDLEFDAPPCWGPLERIATLCNDHPDLPHVDPDQFMYMGRVVRRERPPVHLYKHVSTRRYLCLDPLGHAFVVTARSGPGEDGPVIMPVPDLASAMARVLRAHVHPSAAPPDHGFGPCDDLASVSPADTGKAGSDGGPTGVDQRWWAEIPRGRELLGVEGRATQGAA
jgi:hypothetical protein